MRQPLDRAQRPGAEVEAVDLGAAELRPHARDRADRLQQRRLAGARCAEDEHRAVLVGLEVGGQLLLPLREVGEPEEHLRVALDRQLPEVDRRRQVVEPRAPGGGDARVLGRADERLHDALLVVGAEVLVVRVGFGDPLDLPHRDRAEAQLGDPHLGGDDLVLGRPAARVGRLEGHEPAGTRLRDAAARDARVERRRDRIVDDILRVGLVGHAQGDAQVGVGAQVVLDDARGALRRHDEVDAEGATALRDVDDAVDELRHLLRERRELVDHEHERRRRLGVLPLLELEQVLRLLAVEQVLAVVQLGLEARERPAHEVRAQVGDEAHAVRQLDAVGEGAAALVVDEQERDAIGAVRCRHAEHPRLQELGLAGAGRAADERVRSLRAQVEGHDVARALSHDRAQRARPLEPRELRAAAVDDRRVLPPAVDDRRRILGDLVAHEREEHDGVRDVGAVVDDDARVDDGREALREHAHVLERDALDGDALLRLARAHGPGPRRIQPARDVDEAAARGGERLDGRSDEDAVDADVGAALEDLREARAVDGRVVRDDDDDARGDLGLRDARGALDVGAEVHRRPAIGHRAAVVGRLGAAHDVLLERVEERGARGRGVASGSCWKGLVSLVVCGSHLSQSSSAVQSGSHSATATTSFGACRPNSCTEMPRSTSAASPLGPAMPIEPDTGRDSNTGTPST